MTKKNHHPLDDKALRLMARLVQLHLQTHPERIARQFGVTAGYVRQQWRNLSLAEMVPLNEALAKLDVGDNV